MSEPSAPKLRPAPERPRGFIVRLNLEGATPEVWRRLELPGDLTLPQVHDVIQIAMGWENSHLHAFQAGRGRRSTRFVTPFDLSEGDTLEDDVRLDQVVSSEGNTLWYEYDFGDGWEHRLTVEKVLDEAPPRVRCIAGEMACPPEDCGGIPGYEELADWVRAGHTEDLRPLNFETTEDALEWLPEGWDPDAFDPDDVNAALELVTADVVDVVPELDALAARFEFNGDVTLRRLLSGPAAHGPTTVSPEEAARVTETFTTFLDVIGGGVKLTSAGYLPPVIVERIAQDCGITRWWIGKVNREDLTPPVAAIRASARDLGLVSVRKGVLAPTAAARRCSGDPGALVRHIAGRLPLGRKDAVRQAGWMALAAAAGGVPLRECSREVSGLLYSLGWRSGWDHVSPPPGGSPTLDVLRHLGGAARDLEGLPENDPAVSAIARSVIRLT